MGCSGIQPRETDFVGRAWCGRGLRDRQPINDKTDRKKPSAWRKGTRKTRRSVNAVSIAQSENFFGAPGRPDGDGRHASVASAESHSVTSPRWTEACSYADQFPTRYFVLYFGWTFDLMSRSCTRSGHRGQRAYSCLVAAEGLCTNAPTRARRGRWSCKQPRQEVRRAHRHPQAEDDPGERLLAAASFLIMPTWRVSTRMDLTPWHCA